MSYTAALVADRRRQMGLLQRELASLLGISVDALESVEQDRRPMPAKALDAFEILAARGKRDRARHTLYILEDELVPLRSEDGTLGWFKSRNLAAQAAEFLRQAGMTAVSLAPVWPSWIAQNPPAEQLDAIDPATRGDQAERAQARLITQLMLEWMAAAVDPALLAQPEPVEPTP